MNLIMQVKIFRSNLFTKFSKITYY